MLVLVLVLVLVLPENAIINKMGFKFKYWIRDVFWSGPAALIGAGIRWPST